jgi:DNA-binding PadR family transcriptional regulator
MLDLAILGLLEEQELHGYEIRKRLREQLGLLANVSFGSLYPALNRLEGLGAVVATEEQLALERAPAPLTGSLSGELAVLRSRRHGGNRGRRSRKVYRITDSGRQLFAELLAGGGAAGDDARNFGLRLAFARHLPPGARLSLLERRRALLLERLDQVSHATKDQTLDMYARSVIEHTAEGVQQDVRWLDRLIEAERLAAVSSSVGAIPLSGAPGPDADADAEPTESEVLISSNGKETPQ